MRVGSATTLKNCHRLSYNDDTVVNKYATNLPYTWPLFSLMKQLNMQNAFECIRFRCVLFFFCFVVADVVVGCLFSATVFFTFHIRYTMQLLLLLFAHCFSFFLHDMGVCLHSFCGIYVRKLNNNIYSFWPHEECALFYPFLSALIHSVS